MNLPIWCAASLLMDATTTATATATSILCSCSTSFINGGFHKTRQILCSTLPFPSTFSPSPLRSLNFSPRNRPFNEFVSCCNLPNSTEPVTADRIAVIIEVDGVLIDVYRSGNRQAFNVAFQKLGLDCAKWTEPVYSDLLRKGDGNEERMLATYFDRIGWPTSLPTNEKGSFMKSLLLEKGKALADILVSEDTPLRPGVEKFIDDACDDGIGVVILTATSNITEGTARGAIEKLGLGRMSKLKFVGKKEVENSFFGQLVRGLERFSGLDEDLASEANKAAAAEKKRIAEEVASKLKLRVNIDTNIAESVKEIVAALRAGAEIADVSVDKCMLVAGNQRTVTAAEIIGMPCIFLRSRQTSRAEFPSGVSSMDGFGSVGLTVSKLRSKLSRASGS